MNLTISEPMPAASGTLQLSPVVYDTETYYTKEYSVTTLGNEGYCRDPRFENYLLILKADDFEYVGHPKDAPWDKLIGRTLLHHNRGFDHAVIQRTIEQGVVPAFVAKLESHCTANMCVYFGLPRALAAALKVEFGIEHDKSVRNKDMVGIRHADLEANPALKEKVYHYAKLDGEGPLKLWKKYGHKWPEMEKWVSNETYRMCSRGVAVDKAGIEKDIAILTEACRVSLGRLPWVKEGYAILSKKALGIECEKLGIEMPASLAQDSEECIAWEEKYGDKVPFVRDMRNYRRSNSLLKKFTTMLSRIGPDGRMPYSLLYYGGSTGRFSGSGGLNLQNAPKEPLKFDADWNIIDDPRAPAFDDRSVDMRCRIVAPKNKLLAAVDFAQIEARVTPWIAGDRATLDRIRPPAARKLPFKEMLQAEVSVYQVHAELSMGWKGEEADVSKWNLKKADKILYALAKARVLGLGFGCGWNKFIALAKKMLDAATFKKVFGAPTSLTARLNFITYLGRIQFPTFTKQSMTEAEQKKVQRNRERAIHLFGTRDNPHGYNEVMLALRDVVTREIFPVGAELSAWVTMSSEEQDIWVNSWLQVVDFREKNPKIVELWKRLGDSLRESIGSNFTITLPSGRVLYYHDVHLRGDSIYAYTTRSDHASRVYGPLLAENCLARGTEVLTETRGWVPIEKILKSDKVWDGVTFVAHEGVVPKGVQPVVSCEGVYCTEDHRFLTQDGWRTAKEINHERELVEARRLDGRDQWVAHSSEEDQDPRGGFGVGGEVPVRGGEGAPREKILETPFLREDLSELPAGALRPAHDARAVEAPGVRGVELDEAEVSGSESPGVPQLRGPGDNGLPGVGRVVRVLLGNDGADVEEGVGHRSDRQLLRVLPFQLPLGYEDGKLEEQENERRGGGDLGLGGQERDRQVHPALSTPARSPSGRSGNCDAGYFAHVFDIVNCGPRRAFVARRPGGSVAVIAHNCVQATARDLLVTALKRLRDAGFEPILHVHDEIIVEVNSAEEADIVTRIMCENPPWAKSLPIGAEPDVTLFYRKG